MREPGDTTKAGGNVTTAGRPPVLPTERPAACLGGRSKACVLSFSLYFHRRGFSRTLDRAKWLQFFNSFEEKCAFSPSCQKTSGSSFPGSVIIKHRWSREGGSRTKGLPHPAPGPCLHVSLPGRGASSGALSCSEPSRVHLAPSEATDLLGLLSELRPRGKK